MFPDSSGATTPLAPIASKPQKNDDIDGAADRGKPPSLSSTESGSVKSPEPHWDSVIGAATD